MDPIHLLAAVDFLVDPAERARQLEASFARRGTGRRPLHQRLVRARRQAR